MIKEFRKDQLKVEIFASRDEMAYTAARDIAACMRKLLSDKDTINVIFAAAPSQSEMLGYLCEETDIDWNHVRAFHMDEYTGLDTKAPQGFGNFLKKHIFSKKTFLCVNYIDSAATDHEAECQRYTKLLESYPADIVCMGIGENGHIAFNDPHVARFDDKQLVKVVTLDEVCRMQQVNDGCFQTLAEVPTQAITLTIPALMAAEHVFCVVPAQTKADAVRHTVEDAISERCPAGILRRHPAATLYCDPDSAGLLMKNQ